MSFLVPPAWYTMYAVIKYQSNRSFVPALALSGLAMLFLVNVGMISSNRKMN